MDLQTSERSQSGPVNEILYINFNQDFTCFVCGTESGFRVYSTDPFRLTHRRDFEHGGGVGVVTMLFRTNILALSGGGSKPRFQPTKVMLWDDRTARVVAELSFRSPVKAVRLRRDLVVVVLERKVYVYGFRSLRLLNSIETIGNPRGLCCLSVGTDRVALICPGMQQGRALVVFYPKAFGELQAPVDRERTTIIPAHEAPIAAMGIDYNGTMLATASDKGTIVRIFDASTGARIQELRRGVDPAKIHSLTFGPAGDFLAVASDKGTVHIFAVQSRQLIATNSVSTRSSLYASGASLAQLTSSQLDASIGSVGSPYPNNGGPHNSKSNLQRIARVLPSYFSSEWSLAQFRVPDYRCLAAFGSDPHTVVIICANGSYYRARFNPLRGGEMIQEDYQQFDDASCGAVTPSAPGAPGNASASTGTDTPESAMGLPSGGVTGDIRRATTATSLGEDVSFAVKIHSQHDPDAEMGSNAAPSEEPYAGASATCD